jgi:hypothetical protein
MVYEAVINVAILGVDVRESITYVIPETDLLVLQLGRYQVWEDSLRGLCIWYQVLGNLQKPKCSTIHHQ